MNDLQKIHSAINNSKGSGASKYILEVPFEQYRELKNTEDPNVNITEEEYNNALECVKNGGSVYLHIKKDNNPKIDMYLPLVNIATIGQQKGLLFGEGDENYPYISFSVSDSHKA